ncbi:MAG: hypothetical protein PVSMB8_00830 [Vulcanimicrobiaceae bacterium]
MIPIVVDSRIRIPLVELTDEVESALCRAFEHRNPAHAKLRALGIPAWKEPPTIVTWRRSVFKGSKGYQSTSTWVGTWPWAEGIRSNAADRSETWIDVPRGGLARVREVLRATSKPWEVFDRRVKGKAVRLPEHMVKMRGYQTRMVDAALEQQNCLWRASTGCGKTCAAFALAAEVETPTLVIVWAAPLFDQWIERIEREFELPRANIGTIRGGKWNLQPLTVAMQQTLASAFDKEDSRAEQARRYFGAIVFDEVHRAAAATCFASVDPFPARFRLGVSDDERRKDGKDFLINDLFGDVAIEVTREELVAEGYILDVEVRIVPTSFRADWYGMPDEDDDPNEEARHVDFNRLLEEMAADEARTALLLDTMLAEIADGRQVLVFCHRREMCRQIDRELVKRGVRTGFLMGGPENQTEYRRTIDGLKAGKIQAGVGTIQALGQGIDLPRVGVGIVATPIAGNRTTVRQVWGRLCRTMVGKTDARLYCLWDRFVYEQHAGNLARWNARCVIKHGERWEAAKNGRGNR